MSITKRLGEIAEEIANQMEGRARGLERQLQDAKAQVAKIEAQLNAANFSRERVFKFSPSSGSEYHCPHCWIEREVVSPLKPVDTDDDAGDLFRCRNCGFELSVPF